MTLDDHRRAVAARIPVVLDEYTDCWIATVPLFGGAVSESGRTRKSAESAARKALMKLLESDRAALDRFADWALTEDAAGYLRAIGQPACWDEAERSWVLPAPYLVDVLWSSTHTSAENMRSIAAEFGWVPPKELEYTEKTS